jgi:hypothetical protein
MEQQHDDDLSDPVFDDMAMTNSIHKRKFFELCRKTFEIQASYENVYGVVRNRNDWKVFVSFLLQMGRVDLDDADDCEDTFLDAVDKMFLVKGGRIISLDYDNEYSNRSGIFPAGVFRLDHLKHLEIYHVHSLPLKELSLLPRLQNLEINFSSDLVSNSILAAPKSVKFPRLKRLCLEGLPTFQMLFRCEALQALGLSFDSLSEIDLVRDLLCSADFASAETLQTIELHNCKRMKGRHLEPFLFDIIPRLPNLQKLYIAEDLIVVFLKVVANRLRTDKSCRISKSLREVAIYGRIEQIADSDEPAAQTDLLTFLETFVAVDSFGCFYRNFEEELYWDNSVRHALIINMAGRRLLKGNVLERVPLSLWPVVLQRFQRRADGRFPLPYAPMAKATGLYYLLREGPVLLDPRAPVRNQPSEYPTPEPKRQRRK